ncbi:hypothetical protein A8G00_08785 [Sphingobium sp. SA916]|nr:hypothetical protein A8G00_08785 [Sphingobium sp. SA916]
MGGAHTAWSVPQPFDAPSLYKLTAGGSKEKRGLALATLIEAELPSLSEFLGPAPWTVHDLIGRYQCSRETIREAIGILDSRGLIRMKSGRNGGVTSALPPVGKVVQVIANHFCLSGVTVAELCEATEILRAIVVRILGQRRPIAFTGKPEKGVEDFSVDGASVEAESRYYQSAAYETGNAVAILTMALMDLMGNYALKGGAPVEANLVGRPGEQSTHLVAATDETGSCGSSQFAVALKCCLLTRYGSAVQIPRDHAVATEHNTGDRGAILLANHLFRDGITSSSDASRISFENKIVEHYNVGLRRVRQAIRILEDAGMVECRPGRGKGVMMAGQNSSTLQRRVFGYLAANGFDEVQYATYVTALDCEIAREAAKNITTADRPWLQSIICGMREDIENSDPVRALGRLLAVHDRLIFNPLVKMWRKALSACNSKLFPQNITIAKPDVSKFIEAWINVAEGIMTGDPDEAERRQFVASAFLFRRWWH